MEKFDYTLRFLFIGGLVLPIILILVCLWIDIDDKNTLSLIIRIAITSLIVSAVSGITGQMIFGKK